MFQQLLQYQDIGWLILRLTIAAIFIYHGLPKLTKSATMASGIGWPVWGIIILGLVEILAPIALILGIYTQLAALILAIDMAGAIYYKIFRWKMPFMAMDKTGWEFDLILLAANIAILLGGGGNIKLL